MSLSPSPGITLPWRLLYLSTPACFSLYVIEYGKILLTRNNLLFPWNTPNGVMTLRYANQLILLVVGLVLCPGPVSISG